MQVNRNKEVNGTCVASASTCKTNTRTFISASTCLLALLFDGRYLACSRCSVVGLQEKTWPEDEWRKESVYRVGKKNQHVYN